MAVLTTPLDYTNIITVEPGKLEAGSLAIRGLWYRP